MLERVITESSESSRKAMEEALPLSLKSSVPQSSTGYRYISSITTTILL